MRTKERDMFKTITFDMFAENSPWWGVSRNGVNWMVRRTGQGQYYYNIDFGLVIVGADASAQTSSGLIAQPINIGIDGPHTFVLHIFNHVGNYADSVHRVICTALDRRL